MSIRWLPAGDHGLLLEFGDTIQDATARYVRQVATALQHDERTLGWSIIPSYATIVITYPVHTELSDVLSLVQPALSQAPSYEPGRTLWIPLCSDADLAPDLEWVASRCQLSPAEVVASFCAPAYRIDALGFAPGFPYLAGLPEALETPRRNTPRTHVAAGSIAIGGRQAGIYPLRTPGGWNIIGRTPLRLFRPEDTPPIPYSPGDLVRFVAVPRAEFDMLALDPAALPVIEVRR